MCLSLRNLGNLIGTPGNGLTSASPEKIVFFVSDGVNHSYKLSGYTKKTTGGRCQEPINTAACAALKSAGYKVAVLYTTYLPRPTNSWYNSWIKPFQSETSPNMSACAFPGCFLEVSPSESISGATNALFLKIINTPRIFS